MDLGVRLYASALKARPVVPLNKRTRADGRRRYAIYKTMSSNKKTLISAIARTGYTAKGLVYFMVGLLTLQAAIGMGGETSDATDAFREFIDQPFGSVLLISVIVGLIAYASWRMLQGITDPQQRGDGAKVVFLRIIDFSTGLLYLAMSYAAWQILQGLGAEDGDESTEVWVERVMELPYGSWLVMLLAIAILAGGVFQFYSAWTARFESSFSSRMNDLERRALRWLGRVGVSAWGVVYCMVAFLFYQASVSYDSQEAGGLSDALDALQDQPYGTWVLAITAGGLITYGVYLLALAYYHKLFEDS